MRKASRKYVKEDKEDATEQPLIHGCSVTKTNSSNGSEMQHRLRKPTSNINNNNNNTTNNSTNVKQTSCDKTGNDVDYHNTEVLLKDGGRVVEQLKMATFHGSPTHSASIASSNQTEQTHCDSPRNNNNNNPKASVEPTSETGHIDGAEPRAPLAEHDSMHSLNGSVDSEEAALKARVRDQATMLTPVVSSTFHLLFQPNTQNKIIHTHTDTYTHSHPHLLNGPIFNL